MAVGKAAMVAVWAGRYGFYYAQPDVNWAFAPIPKARRVAPDHSYFGIAIMRGTAHREEAWQFIKWVAGTPHYTLLRRVPPARPDHYGPWLQTVFGDQAKERRAHLIAEGIGYGQPSDGLQYHPSWKEMEKDVINPALQRLNACQAQATALLRKMKPVLQAIADRNPVRPVR